MKKDLISVVFYSNILVNLGMYAWLKLDHDDTSILVFPCPNLIPCPSKTKNTSPTKAIFSYCNMITGVLENVPKMKILS